VIEKLIKDQQLLIDLGQTSAVAFFYFDFKDKACQSVKVALRHLVLQLSAQSPHPCKALETEWGLSKGQVWPSYRDLQHILKELLRGFGRTYIVLDALDECEETEFEELICLITKLRGWTETPLHLLITSQLRTLFTDAFGDVTHIYLEPTVMERDIRLFVEGELRGNSKMKMWAANVDKIVEQVVLKSSGM
jgi:hypothetical protein